MGKKMAIKAHLAAICNWNVALQAFRRDIHSCEHSDTNEVFPPRVDDPVELQ